MTVDIASLGIAVDTTQVKQATVDLDKLGDAGANASEKVKASNTAFTQFNDCLTGAERAAKQAAQAAATLAAEQQALGANTNSLTIGQQLFMDKLRDQAAAAGLSKSALMELRAAEMGMSDAAAPLIAQIEAAEASMGGFSLANAGATRELAIMGREIGNGNLDRLAGSMTVLASRSGLLPLLFSPIGLGLIAIGAAIGIVIYEMVEMSNEIDKFNNSLTLTNNYAGLTRDSMAAMANSIQTSATGGVRAATTMLSGLAATGKFTGGELAAVGQTALRFGELTGQSSEQVIKYFSGMKDGVANFADNANQSYHFMDAAQYEHIATLEKQGKSQQAVIEVMRAMNDSMDTQNQKVGLLTASYRGWVMIIDDVSTAFKQVVFPTLGDSVKKATDDLASMRVEAKAAADSWGAGPAIKADWDVKIAEQKKLIHDLIAKSNAEEIAAGQKQHDDLLDQAGVAGAKAFDQTKLNLRNQAELRDAAATKIRADADAANASAESHGKQLVYTDADVNEQIARSNASFADKAVKDDPRPLLLANALKANQDLLASEKAKYDALGAMDDLYHKYGVTSDSTYFAQKRDLALQYEQAEINAYDKDLDLLVNHDNETDKEMVQTQGKIDAVYAKKLLAVQKYNDDKTKFDTEEALMANAVVQASDAAANKYITDLNKQIAALQAANGARETSKSAIEGETIAMTKLAIANLQASADAPVDSKHTQADIDAANKFILMLNAELNAQQQLADAYKKQEADAYLVKSFAEANAAAKQMETDLTASFGNIGTAIGKMGVAFTENGKIQHDIQDQYLKDMAAASTAADVQAAQTAAAQKKQNAQTTEQLKNYGDMAGAATEFFDKNSTGYKVMEDVQRVFRLAEMAMTMEAQFVKLTAITTNVAADQAATGDSVTNSGVRATADGIAAFAKTLASVPFPYNLAAGAVVIAALAAAGVAITGGGSDASAPDPNAAQQMQKTQGTGTSAGDITKQSDSITASITLLTANSSAMLPLTNQMVSSLKNIEGGISGVANIISGNAVTAASTHVSTGMTVGMDAVTSAMGKLSTTLTDYTMGGFATSGAIGKIANFFSGSTSASVTDGGIKLDGTVGQLAQGHGVDDYANVNTTTKGPLGGLFGGNHSSDSTVTQTADTQTVQQFGLIFSALQNTFATAATAIGANATAVGAAVAQIPIQATISLQGLTGTALTTALNTVLSATTDKIVSSLVSSNLLPNLSQFAQVGEGYLTTLVRVASGVEQANVAMQGLGLTAVSYTSIINKQGDVTTEIERQTIEAAQTLKGGVLSGIGQIIQSFNGSAADLVTLYIGLKATQSALHDVALNGKDLSTDMLQGAGGQANLDTGLSDYLKDFFTPAEKVTAETQDLSDKFTALGETMPTSLAGFRAMVEGIDTSTAAGQKLVGGLLSLSGAFFTMTTDTQALATATTDSATAAKTATDAMAGILAQMDQVSALQKSLGGSVQTIAQNAPGYDMGGYLAGNVTTAQTAFDNVSGDTSSASLTDRIAAAGDLQTAIMASYNYQQNALNAQATAEQSAHTANIAAQNQAIATANALAASFKAIGTYATGLLTGDLTDISGKQKSAVLQATYQTNLSGAQGNDPTSISALTGSADAYLKDKLAASSTMQQYAATFQQVQSQLSTLGARGGVTMQSVVDSGFTMSNDLQQKMIALQASATAQLKVVQDKTTVWQDALKASLSDQATAFNNLGLTADDILKALTGLDSRIGTAVADALKAAGLKASTGALMKPPVPTFADGGTHDGGWAVVGEQGPELMYSGPAQIATNGTSKSLFNTDAMVAELRALRVALTTLQKAADKSATSNATVANIFQRVTLGGTSIQTMATTS